MMHSITMRFKTMSFAHNRSLGLLYSAFSQIGQEFTFRSLTGLQNLLIVTNPYLSLEIPLYLLKFNGWYFQVFLSYFKRK